MAGNPYKINDNCVACGLCVNACPIDAIANYFYKQTKLILKKLFFKNIFI